MDTVEQSLTDFHDIVAMQACNALAVSSSTLTW